MVQEMSSRLKDTFNIALRNLHDRSERHDLDKNPRASIALAVKRFAIAVARFGDDRCRRPRRLRMQMLIVEFVLSRIMHRTASGSRRPAELPTDKTDCWKCMANNPIMHNASRNVDAYALPVQITRVIISAVTSRRQLQTVRNFRGWFSNARLRLLSKYPSGTLSLENRLLFANLDAYPDAAHLVAICSTRWLSLNLSIDHSRLILSPPAFHWII